MLYSLLTGDLPPRFDELERALTTLDERWVEVIRRGMASDPRDRYPSIAAWALAVEAAMGDGSGILRAGAAARMAPDACPYMGLAAFQPEDADRFFGRGPLVDDLLARLTTTRTLVVGGASGSGKSSVVRAGVIPAVRGGAIPGSDRWPIALLTPGPQPLKELHYQLERAHESATAGVGVPVGSIDDLMHPRRLADGISDHAGGLLLVIDQFEELFTLERRDGEIEDFLEALAAMVDPADSRVRVVIIARADFYGRMSTYPWLARIISANQVLVGPMSRSELREVIIRPAERVGLRLEDDLVDAVLEDGGASVGSLPLISHALAETWRRRSGSRLTLENYRATGGVAGAIGQTAESLYSSMLTTDQQRVARRLLLRLVRPGQGVADTRRPIGIEDLDADPQPHIMHEVAEALSAARLLTIDDENVQLAHEAIIRSWPRLGDWINSSRDDLRFQQRIGRAAHEWDSSGRDADLLYRGTPLAAALEWREAHDGDLNALEAEFLDLGEAARNEQHEAEAATAQRARRARRAAFAVMAALTVSAVAASVVAVIALGNARTNEAAANERLARSLASQASELADDDPRLALALATELIGRTDESPVQARETIVAARLALSSATYAPASMPHVVGDALTVALRSDGELVATGARDGTLSLWDARGDLVAGPIDGPTSQAIEELVFLDGGDVLGATLAGEIVRWDLSTVPEIADGVAITTVPSIAWSVAMAPDGSRFATAAEDGIIRLHDAADPSNVVELVDLDGDSLTVQFNNAGTVLMAGNGAGQVLSWNLADNSTHLEPLDAHRSDVWEIEFSPDDSMFATASSDGRVRLWDAATGAPIATPFEGAAGDVRGVQFGVGDVLVAGDEAGQLQFFNHATGMPLGASAMAHSGQVSDAAAAPTGRIVSLGIDQTIRVWEASDESGVGFAPHDRGSWGIDVSADGTTVASGDGAGGILVSSADGTPIHGPLAVGEGTVWAVAVSADGAFVAGSDAAGTIVVFDGATGAELRRSQGGGGPIFDLAFSPDGDTLVSGGADGLAHVWDVADLTIVRTFSDQHVGGVTAVEISPDGRVAIADRVGEVRIWNLDGDLQAAWRADEKDNTVWGLGWSADGTELATAHADEFVLIWTVADQSARLSLTPHPGGATDVAFLPDGETVVTLNRDGTIAMWDVALGSRIGPAIGQTGAPRWRIAANAVNGVFVTTHEGGLVESWDLLDLDAACRRSSWDSESIVRFLGPGETPVACR